MTEKKIILITGASRGLGRAMVAEFIRLGHTVIACGRSPEAVAELQTQFKHPHRFKTIDVTSDQQVSDWASELAGTFAPPDLLLNNAAITNHKAPLWKVPAAEFSAVIDTNIKGVANVIRHFVPAMIARSSGIIVNFSSGWGRSVSPEVAPYCASKWAIEGMTQALALELPSGMATVALDPGVINTDMLRISFGSAAEKYPSPEKWAESAVPFLLRLTPKDNGRPMKVA